MRSRGSAVLAILVVLVAACATDAGVASRRSSQSPDSTSASTNPPESEPFDEPDAPDAPLLPAGDPELRTGVLANGLTYYIRDNDNPGGSAELRLAVNAGSAREEADQSAVAHFLEHMLFNGTQQFPENELIEILRQSGAQFGADVNAYTSYDETVYQLTVQTRDAEPLNTALDVLLEWLTAATLDPVEVDKERGVVLDEWRNSEQSSDGRISDAIEGLFLDDSLYEGRDPIGTDTAISAMTPELLRRFYDDWYRPDNAAVVVVGAIDVDEVEAGIRERFEPVTPRGASPAASPLFLEPADASDAAVLADPDLTSSFAEVTLPTPALAVTAQTREQAILDEVAFAVIANRLSDDATLGEQPFDDAYVSNNDLVRTIDAPSVVVEAKPDHTEAAMVALLDEFERVSRFGFDAAEIDRAVAELESAEQADFDSTASRQDRDYADEYSELYLTATDVYTAQTLHDFTMATLAAVDPAAAGEQFAQRWHATYPHVLVVAPASEAADLPSVDEVLATIDALPERDLDERNPSSAAIEQLMERPQPAVEESRMILPSHPEVYLDSPVQLTFANGVTVIVNTTPIVENQFVITARRSGGLALVADDDVHDASVAVDVVTNGGVGEFDQAQLNQFLSGSTAMVYPSINSSTDEIEAGASTADMETVLQLIHLYLTEPRFDPVAFDSALSDVRASAADPTAAPGPAGYDAVLRLRYGDDPRFQYLLSNDEADTIDLEGVRRVWTQRFGNANGWTFVFNGSFDLDTASDLARAYLGTLPATGDVDPAIDIEPPPPSGIVAETVHAGSGDIASLYRVYTGEVEHSTRTLTLSDLATEVLSNRLLKTVREEFGESYSPNAAFLLTPLADGVSGTIDCYIVITSAPEGVESVATHLSAQIDDLATNGPTADEIEAARAVIFEHYNLISNEELNEVLLGSATGIGQNVDDYVGRLDALAALSDDDVAGFLADVLALDRYVEVRVVPR